MAVTTVVFFQLLQVLNSRSLSLSVFKTGVAGNPFLFLALSMAFLSHMAVLYIPQLEWLTVELDKHLRRKARIKAR